MTARMNNVVRLLQRTILMVGLGLSASAAMAGVISNGGDTGGIQIQYAESVGQSFVAEDPHVLASLYYLTFNPSWPVSNITLSLYHGTGVGGTFLGSDTFSLSAGFNGFHDSDFSSVTLAIGDTYSLAASIPGDSPYWGIRSGNGYAGGTGFSAFGLGGDYVFHVIPTAASVPEPGSLALTAFGLFGLGAARKRKHG